MPLASRDDKPRRGHVLQESKKEREREFSLLLLIRDTQRAHTGLYSRAAMQF